MIKPRWYFSMPNDIFRLGLDPDEIAVYAYLMYVEDRKTYKCWLSFNTIGDTIDRSKNSVEKYVDGLVENGRITVDRLK